MVNRVINKNNGYSDNLFSRNNSPENKTLNLVDGATALKLEDEVYTEQGHHQNIETDVFDNLDNEKIPSGLSLENTSYIEQNNTYELNEAKPVNKNINDDNSDYREERSGDINSPRIFTDDLSNLNEGENLSDNVKNDGDINAGNLFDEEGKTEEDDFEIPAFLRKQKY